MLREIDASDIASQIRRVSPFSVSSRIYFSVRNDTATFSARISHRGIARRRDTARPSDETFRASSLLRLSRLLDLSPPPSFLPASDSFPPSSFSSPASRIRREVSSTLLRPAPISRDLLASRPLHLTRHRRAGDERICGRTS